MTEASNIFSLRRCLASVVATWSVSIVLGLSGVPDYQRGVASGIAAVATLWFLHARASRGTSHG